MPHDIVGGDFYAIRQLDADHYGFLLADVMGHGVAAALHTMHLSSLVGAGIAVCLAEPAEFAATVNNELAKVVKDESFATAICGVIDAEQRTLRSRRRAARRSWSSGPTAASSSWSRPASRSG